MKTGQFELAGFLWEDICFFRLFLQADLPVWDLVIHDHFVGFIEYAICGGNDKIIQKLTN